MWQLPISLKSSTVLLEYMHLCNGGNSPIKLDRSQICYQSGLPRQTIPKMIIGYIIMQFHSHPNHFIRLPSYIPVRSSGMSSWKSGIVPSTLAFTLP